MEQLREEKKLLHDKIVAEIRRVLNEKFNGSYELSEDDEYEVLQTYDDFGEYKWKLKELYQDNMDVYGVYEDESGWADDYTCYAEFTGTDRVFRWLELLNNKEI